MAFNITNLVNAINAKSVTVGADSALDKAVLLASNVKNALIYSSLVDLPTADSSNQGDLVRIGASFGADTKYYVSHRDRWNLIGLDDSDVATGGQIPPFQGSNYGYASGGSQPSLPGPSNIIDKFPFSSDANATDVGNLTVGRYGLTGQSSQTHGYTSGGWNGADWGPIDKFPFTSDANATDVGDLTVPRYNSAGQSSSESGYTSGGRTGFARNTIDKFPFSTDANATDVGDLTLARYYPAGQSDVVNGFGYTSGGDSPPAGLVNVIDKFPFSADANATDVGDLSVTRSSVAGQSSTTHGYTSGGESPPNTNVIDKFPFASGGNASDVGDLTSARRFVAGQSSTTHGYASGGHPLTDDIQKFPFSTDANATYVGDLSVARFTTAGQQY